MSGDGLEYMPEGLRRGGRGSHDSADAAEESKARLRRTNASSSHFGGAGAESFVSSLHTTRDTQARGVERAQEDRDEMGSGAVAASDIGIDTDVGATTALRGSVSDGMRGAE